MPALERDQLRTAARIATEPTKTFSSVEEINLLRSKVTIHISALVYAWQQRDCPLPEGTDLPRPHGFVCSVEWMEALIFSTVKIRGKRAASRIVAAACAAASSFSSSVQ